MWSFLLHRSQDFVKTLEKKYDDAVQAQDHEGDESTGPPPSCISCLQEAKQKTIKQGGLSMMKAVQAHNRRLHRATVGAMPNLERSEL